MAASLPQLVENQKGQVQGDTINWQFQSPNATRWREALRVRTSRGVRESERRQEPIRASEKETFSRQPRNFRNSRRQEKPTGSVSRLMTETVDALILELLVSEGRGRRSEVR